MNYNCEIIKFLVFILVLLSIVSCSQESAIPSETVSFVNQMNESVIADSKSPRKHITSDEALLLGANSKEKGKFIIVESSEKSKYLVSDSNYSWVISKMPASY